MDSIFFEFIDNNICSPMFVSRLLSLMAS